VTAVQCTCAWLMQVHNEHASVGTLGQDLALHQMCIEQGECIPVRSLSFKLPCEVSVCRGSATTCGAPFQHGLPWHIEAKVHHRTMGHEQRACLHAPQASNCPER